MSVALEARGLFRLYRVRRGPWGVAATVHAVNGVDLAVEAGSVLGLVGESGCGKSTLGRLLLGLESPSAGEVALNGRRLNALNRLERARSVQIVFQDPHSSLNPRKTILSIVALPLRIHRLGNRSERERRAREMLEVVGLPRRIHSAFPAELSGGQRQRVAIARALVMRPNIVICDEPTSALDVSVQAQILNLLQDLQRELNLTYVLISHNLAVVQHMATHVAVMYLGRIVEQNEATSIFTEPRHPYTRLLLKSALTANPALGLPRIDLGINYPNPTALPPGCRFHPRCPERFEPCRTMLPAPQAVRPNGMVECHLYDAAIARRP
jgi:peptide/nickel transport system ATP-binding protein